MIFLEMDVLDISIVLRSKWEVEDAISDSEIKFNLPSRAAEIFPQQNGEVTHYQIFVVTNSTAINICKCKLAFLLPSASAMRALYILPSGTACINLQRCQV